MSATSSLIARQSPVEPCSDALLILGSKLTEDLDDQLSLSVFEPAVGGETVIGHLEYRQEFASVLMNGESAVICII